MQRDEWRVRPVEQPGWQAAMLTEREPMPDVIGVRLTMGVLAEISEQVQFEPFDAGAARSQTNQPAGQVVVEARPPAKRVRRPETTERRVPRARNQRVHEAVPCRRPNHHAIAVMPHYRATSN